jgi:hypothetical protein
MLHEPDTFSVDLPGANRSAVDRLAAATNCNLAATDKGNRVEESRWKC